MNKETKFLDFIGIVFKLPFNLGVLLLSFITWFGLFFFTYSSTNNFNLYPTILNYMMLLSALGILIGTIMSDAENIARWSIISFILGILSLMSIKIFALQTFGLFFISPLSLYAFFSVLKSIWQKT